MERFDAQHFDRAINTLTVRVERMETRLVQLMLHLGLDPYSKQYDGPGKPSKPVNKETG
jgi:cystathionine beta-lyase/cystathionine gamma-synthase